MISRAKNYIRGIFSSYDEFIVFMAIIGAALYYARDFSTALFVRAFVMVGFNHKTAVLIKNFVPLVLALPLIVKRRKKLKPFYIIFLVVLAYFAISVLLNLQHLNWYFRPKYGIDKVFLPTGGVFAILFIYLLNDKNWKKNFYHIMIYTAIFIAIISALQYLRAQLRGYWVVTNSAGEEYKLGYSLTFGLNTAFLVNLLIGLFIYNKKKSILVLVAVFYYFILTAGNRSAMILPVILIMLYLIYIIVNRKFSSVDKKKELIKNSFVVLSIAFSVLFAFLSPHISKELQKLPIIKKNVQNIAEKEQNGEKDKLKPNKDDDLSDNRNLDMLMKGEILSGNGRELVYSLSWKGIKTSPILGLGAYGDRIWIAPHLIWGHSHNFILEVWSNMGLILGVPFLLLLANTFFSMLTKKRSVVTIFYFVFVATAAMHMTSISFWLVPYIWTCIGLAMVTLDKEDWWFNKLFNKIRGKAKK